jgi:hypothetical protein
VELRHVEHRQTSPARLGKRLLEALDSEHGKFGPGWTDVSRIGVEGDRTAAARRGRLTCIRW